MLLVKEGTRGVKHILHLKKKLTLYELKASELDFIFSKMINIGAFENIIYSYKNIYFKYHKRLVGRRYHYYIDSEEIKKQG